MMMTDRCQINGRLRFCLVHRRDDTEGRKEEEWGGGEEGTKHAVYTSIKYSQVFRPLFHSIRYPPLLSLFISSPVWPDGLALCPEVDLLISGSASVGNRGRARGTRTRLQQNADCSYTSYPSKCLSQKQNNTEPAERHNFSTLPSLVSFHLNGNIKAFYL